MKGKPRPERGWQDMAFTCLFVLKMSPEQVAALLEPGRPEMQAVMSVLLRDRAAYARRHVLIRSMAGRPKC